MNHELFYVKALNMQDYMLHVLYCRDLYSKVNANSATFYRSIAFTKHKCVNNSEYSTKDTPLIWCNGFLIYMIWFIFRLLVFTKNFYNQLQYNAINNNIWINTIQLIDVHVTFYRLSVEMITCLTRWLFKNQCLQLKFHIAAENRAL